MNGFETVTRFEEGVPATWPRFWWINVCCFLATLITTTLFGSALVTCFRSGQQLDPDLIWPAYVRLIHGDPAIWSGLVFSAPLLLILLAHELGHYLQCRHWRVEATLPFFLPSPSLFGTLGAFIRITTPIFTRCSLFDIGIAGPLAGFAVLMPFLIVGVALSQKLVLHGPASPLIFGSPLAVRWLESIFFPHLPASQIILHPMAMAAWAGLLATAINLLPVGQLDGGHIVYAVWGPRVHRYLSNAFVAALAILGFWYWAWWIWCVVLFFFGRRHPLVYDQEPLPRSRRLLAIVVGIVFLLCFSVVPVRAIF